MLANALPRASRLRQEMSLDVEMYRAAKEQMPDDVMAPPPAPPMSEYTLEAEILAAVLDRLGEVIQATISAAGSKKKIKIKPWPRPETAANIEKRVRRQEVMDHLESVINFVEKG